MAIVTGDLYKGFMFGDISSKAYGVYITQEAAYNAPERDVDVYEIAGRNGAYVLDNGRFRNITVTYKCGIALDSETDFASAIRVFRNALASQAGKYVRLTDEYNPNEFRQAAFLGGIEVNMADKRAGEFTVSFDCKPQRFLISGEIPRTIGGAVTNTQTKSGTVVSIDSDGVDKATSLVAQIEPVQSGSGDPSPTNVRAITGWSTVNATVDGKNLLDTSGMSTAGQSGVTFARSSDGIITVGGHANANTYRVIGTLQTKNGVQYTLTGTPSGGASGKYRMTVGGYGYDYGSGYTFTGDGGAHLVSIDIYTNYPATGSTLTFAPMIRLASDTDGTYEPYTGTTTTTALGRTVYGGTVDVVTGVLTVDKEYKTVNDFNWTYNSANNVFWVNIPEMKRPCTLISSHYSQSTVASLAAIPNNSVWNQSYGFTSKNLVVKDTRFTDASTFKTNMSGVGIVYELETPTTVQLTAQQVELLAGQNNVWADTGDISITYGRDPNKLVNPTLFESRPLLQVWGYGEIDINGETINIDDAVIGDVLLANRMTSSDGIITFSEAQLRAGDDIRMGVSNVVANGFTEFGSTISNPSIIRTEGTIIKNATLDVGTERQIRLRLTLYQNAFESQDPTTKTAQVDIGYNYTPSGGSVQDYVVSCRVQIKYTTGKIEVSALFMSTIDVEFENEPYYETGNVKGYSTKSALGEPLYFDLDIGEAYKDEDGEIISVNNAVSFPAELPTLKAGSNTFTFDNTVDTLKVVPRWWEV